MICDMCKKNEAAVSIEQISDGAKKNIYLCRDCAAKFGFGIFSEKMDISIKNIFNNYELNKKLEFENSPVCPHCGQKLLDIRFKQKIGCVNCFSAFKNEIAEILKQKKKDLRYTGVIQKSKVIGFENKRIAAELRQKLRKAIEAEEYEKAAFLRDELKALEKKYESET
ncbi:UvrB/UvrC motif-containing protein [Treponema pedis]|uniref:UvrB/UvrC motif-containing protein n=1 Tax=Treponema pedis TaxID=409322 RepID=UPI00041394C9|nr:UvrB/UvrC motif-containing protein [Treponema pedis]